MKVEKSSKNLTPHQHSSNSVHGTEQICSFHLVEIKCVFCILQLLKRGDKREHRLVLTSCHLSNGPVWLHRNRLHAPLLQCRSALTSSTRFTSSTLLLYILMSRKQYFSSLGTNFYPPAPKVLGLELKEEAPEWWRMVIKWRIWHWAQDFRIRGVDGRFLWKVWHMKSKEHHTEAWPSTLFYIYRDVFLN